MSDTEASAPPAGVVPPLVTPLNPDNSLDAGSLDALIRHVVDHGAVGVLVLGSTGENGLLARDTRVAVAAQAVESGRGSTHVMVGLPAMGLPDALADARCYASLGAESLLVPPPYGFQLSHTEFVRYYETIAEAVAPTALVAYNIPVRVISILNPALLAELAHNGVLRGVKDSSGNLEAHRLVAEATADVATFRRYTGSELCIDAALLGGFDGAVPGLANVFVEHHVELVERASAGDWAEAGRVQSRIATMAALYDAPLGARSFSATAVGALKEALVQRGVIATSTTAAPFGQPDEALRRHVADVLAHLDDAP